MYLVRYGHIVVNLDRIHVPESETTAFDLTGEAAEQFRRFLAGIAAPAPMEPGVPPEEWLRRLRERHRATALYMHLYLARYLAYSSHPSLP